MMKIFQFVFAAAVLYQVGCGEHETFNFPYVEYPRTNIKTSWNILCKIITSSLTSAEIFDLRSQFDKYKTHKTSYTN